MSQDPVGLGEPLGIGRTAEVFAWRDGTVIKLLRPGFPESMAEDEAVVAAGVTAAGLAAPRYLGSESVGGRIGLVFERIDGSSMLDELTRRPWLAGALARRFAALHAQLHATSLERLPEYRVSLQRAIERARPTLGAARRDAALRWMDRLDEGSSVCHGDMHPGNVIMAAGGPSVIDWLAAGRGPHHADVARTLFLLRTSALPAEIPRLHRAAIALIRRRFASTYLRAYRRLRPLDQRQVALWRLPILAARVGEVVQGEREMLLAAIDDELRREPTRP